MRRCRWNALSVPLVECPEHDAKLLILLLERSYNIDMARQSVLHGKTSPLTGLVNYVTMEYDEEDYKAWINGTPIQDAMPYLSANEREFLMTGITSEEWEEAFGKED